MNPPASGDEVAALAQRLGQALVARGLQVTAAESCTGGLVAAALTDVAGSSAWFGESVVTYANEAKQRLAGVPAHTLQTHGAVSAETVRAMAEGLLARTAADLAIAVSGVAGPGGGSVAKPVGTVWIAVAQRRHGCDVQHHRFDGDRAAVRRQAVLSALRATLSKLSGSA